MPRLSRWVYGRVRGELGRRVLDAGAGIGTYTELLAEDNRAVVSLERDDEFAARLRERFADDDRVTVFQADLASPEGLPDFEPADSALCLNVLEHVEDDVRALRNIRARVEPGGRLIALVPAYPALFNSMDRAMGHYRRYTRRQLLERLAQGGWLVEASLHINVFGVPGWFVAGSLQRRSTPGRDLTVLFDRLLPVFSVLEEALVRGVFGLSIVASCRRLESLPGEAMNGSGSGRDSA